MKLYYAADTVAIAVIIAIKEANLTCDFVNVDFSKGEQTGPEFLAINPRGRVPALKTDQGVLTETGALLDYIHALAPDVGLIPDDPFDAARVRELMYYLASTWHVNHAHGGHGDRWADREESHHDMRRKVPETMRECCDFVENNLLDGPYLLGESFSIADAYLYVVSAWLESDGIDIADYPKLNALRKTIEKRPSVQAALALVS